MIRRGDPEGYLKSGYSRDRARLFKAEEKVEELERLQHSVKLEKKKYAYQNAVSAAPPTDVLKRSLAALDEYRLYTSLSQVLGDYYGIDAPRYLASDEMTPKGANAAYYSESNEVYSPKGKTLKYRTAFHEFWHALERHGIVPKTTDSEKNAEIYAKTCLTLLNMDVNA